MKKVYINPTVEAYLIQTRNNLLTTSDVSVSGDDFNPGSGSILGHEDEFTFEEDNFDFSEDNQFSFGE